ncbi:uncharacterized protein BT62DRAFT_933772 [Guyanagaster necrorhizus]|uniref:F-box domain-containing protein n=1 Tax=Guyanagaster necrorhizus TaxID=856835 RepID=A0A9P8AR21_9AGAR|nr:uncharacterized protein BT62DRAFT_933772 [Guyanagaster necrorhizus MCA 3950]KAG7444724.1 hypothetical protein BT62DRAFT_933772 [Guyanagaster necrorhizus MCA 3950]
MGNALGLPREIWEQCAYYALATETTFLGPPSGLTSILLTCRRINDALCFSNNPRLYARLFCFKFDIEAPRRRLPPRWLTSQCLAAEFHKRIMTLKRIRHCDEYSLQDLWTCYLMMSENDGRNERQLEWTRISEYLFRAVLTRIPSGPSGPGMWYEDPEATSLIIWLFWMLLPQNRPSAESIRLRGFWTQTLLHIFIAAGFRFPSLYAPDTILHLPISPDVYPLPPIISGPNPRKTTVVHYWHNLTVAAPVLTPAALLSWTVRQEMYQQAHPLDYNILGRFPTDRHTANALGIRGPTAEDLTEFHQLRIYSPGPLLLPSHATFDTYDLFYSDDCHHEDEEEPDQTRGSMRYEQDWYREVSCYDPYALPGALRGPVFSLGSLTGSWAGRWVLTNIESHMGLLRGPSDVDPRALPLHSKPLYWSLQEHHCFEPTEPIAPGTDEYNGDDILNAWLPRGHLLTHLDGAIEFYDSENNCKIRYDTFIPRGSREAPYLKPACERPHPQWILNECDEIATDEVPGSTSPSEYETQSNRRHDGEAVAGIYGATVPSDEYVDTVSYRSSGVADVLVTGETGQRHGDAWGHYSIVGRVRPWDGLVVLLQKPADPRSDLGEWIFKGYIHDQNFVGRWRETTTSADTVGYEGGFIVTKTE